VLATGLAAGLAGCVGGGSSHRVDAGALRQTDQITEAAGGAHMEFSASAQLAGLPLRGSGVLDMQHDAYSMSVRLGALATSQVIMTGNKLYFTLPPAMRKGPLAGKRWALVDLAKWAKAEERPGTVDMSQLAPSAAPGRLLEQLRAVGEVKRVGTGTVRGVAATHFHATVNLHEAIALLPPSRRALMQPALDEFLQTGQSSIPVEAWLDDQGRLRRETMTLAGLGTMRLDLYDFGKQPSVIAPPADRTANLTGAAKP
jgi:hypothetical protein